MKAHAEHVEKRSLRVNKYGQGTSEQVLAAASIGVGKGPSAPSYALFSGGLGEVRRRHRGGGGGGSSSSGVDNGATNESASAVRSDHETDSAAHPPTTAKSLSQHDRWKKPSPPVSGDMRNSSVKPTTAKVSFTSPYDSSGSGESHVSLQQSRLKQGRNRQQAAQKVEQSIAQVPLLV